MDVPTLDSLVELLQGVNVERVAKAANVSTKTIYRIKQRAKNSAGDEISPTLDTARRIAEAVRAVRAQESQPASPV